MALKQRMFSMVEVILALIIIVIAIVAITGIFPISMRMHNDTMRQTQATNVAQELMNFAAYNTRKSSDISKAFPLVESDILTRVRTARLDLDPSEWIVNDALSGEEGTQYFFYNIPDTLNPDDDFNNGIIRVFRKHDAYRGDQKVQVTELDVVVAIWRSDNSSTFYLKNYDAGTGNLQFNRAPLREANDVNDYDLDTVRLNLEASWPGSAKYENREKVHMVMEVNLRK